MIYYKEDRYTQKEFLVLMRKEFPEMIAWKLKGIPYNPEKIRKADLARWMEFSGATFIR